MSRTSLPAACVEWKGNLNAWMAVQRYTHNYETNPTDGGVILRGRVIYSYILA